MGGGIAAADGKVVECATCRSGSAEADPFGRKDRVVMWPRADALWLSVLSVMA